MFRKRLLGQNHDKAELMNLPVIHLDHGSMILNTEKKLTPEETLQIWGNVDSRS